MTHFQKILVASGLCAAAQLQVMPSTAGEPGDMPGDEAMTCPQIAAELAPYAQQMAPDFNALADTEQQLMQRSKAREAEAAASAAAASAGAMASSLDPTGLSGKAYGQSEMALQREMWNRALAEDRPLMDQANKQTNAAIGKAMPMQSNARIQRLMQLVKQKNCH